MGTLATLNVKVTGQGINRTTRKLHRLERRAQSAQRRMRRWGRVATRVGGAMTIMGGAFVAAGAAASAFAAKFETAMTRAYVQTGSTKEAVMGLRDEIIQLSKRTAQGPIGLAQGLLAITSAGYKPSGAMKVLESAAKLSALGLGQTETIARALVGVLASYAESNLKASQAANTLFAIVKQGNIEAEELADTMGKLTPIATQLGISLKELGATLATFTRLGVGAQRASTYIRALMNAIMKPSQEAKQALRSMGTSIIRLKQQIRQIGFGNALIGLVKQAERTNTSLAKIFGNVRALTAVLGTAGAQTEDFARVIKKMADNTGLLNKAFQEVGFIIRY